MTSPLTCPVFLRFTVLVAAIGFVTGSGLSTPVAHAQTVRNAEDLMIVDCLLPGQIRRLGTQVTFMSARRPIRTTQADCQIRGGEFVAFDRANYQTALKVWLEPATAGTNPSLPPDRDKSINCVAFVCVHHACVN